MTGPVSDLAAFTDAIRASLTAAPVRTVAEACDRIEQLTGLRREPTQVRTFLKGLGFQWRRIRALPGAAQKNLPDHVREQREFLDGQLRPRLDAAEPAEEHVFFVDAAHFVFGTFLCCLWSIARLFVRAASGRQRFNVLGAWNAVTRELMAITNTTVVNTRDDVRAAAGDRGPGTGRARSRWSWTTPAISATPWCKALAKELGIALLFLPSYSPNLNLIERLWRFMKRQAAYGRYHPTFADFRAAIEDVLGRHTDDSRGQAGHTHDAQLPGI